MLRAKGVKALGAIFLAMGSTFLLLRTPGTDLPWTPKFRDFFAFDQLSYAAIASTAASGNVGFVEPFTETGVSFYPSLWYRFLGVVSGAFGVPVFSVWSVAGLVVILASVGLLGLISYRVSGSWWLPALVGLFIWIGPLSMVLFETWYVSIKSHAVLWGPYASLYTMNAEAIGLAFTALALGALLWSVAGPRNSTRTNRTVLWVICAAVLGFLANIQTYAFLTAAMLLASWLAAWGLMKSQSRTALWWTAAIFVGAVIAGFVLRTSIGALPVFLIMLLATLPGIWLLVSPHRSRVWFPALIFVFTASPQLGLTAWGTITADPFLTYRTEQSGDLGVALWAWIVGTLPIGAVWLWTWLRVRSIAPLAVKALLIALLVTHLLLTFNDWWGFVQEPYRFWISTVTVAALLLPVAAAWGFALPSSQSPSSVIAVSAAALALLSIWNVGGFREFAKEAGTIDITSPRWEAVTQLSEQTEGLVMGERCLDPSLLKIATGSPVAHYSRGIAWPERKDQIQSVMDATSLGVFDDQASRSAGVSFIYTDSACDTGWNLDGQMGISMTDSLSYIEAGVENRITLWRLL